MPKPDYDTWDLMDSFGSVDAAYLWLDEEPGVGEQHPSNIRALASRFRQQMLYKHNPRLLSDPRRVLNPDQFPPVSRTALIAFAEEQGLRPPFLFPEAREIAGDSAQNVLREDTKEGYLFLIGLMAHTIAEMSGPAMRNQKGDPNLARLLERLYKTARTLKVSIEKGDGFTKTPFNNKVSAALEEVRNRQRGWPLSP